MDKTTTINQEEGEETIHNTINKQTKQMVAPPTMVRPRARTPVLLLLRDGVVHHPVQY